MAALDDLVELVERAAAAEKVALASKWKQRSDVAAMITRQKANAAAQRADMARDPAGGQLSARWVSQRRAYLDAGTEDAVTEHSHPLPGPGPGEPVGAQPVSRWVDAAQAERDASAAVQFARLALTDAAVAVLRSRVAHIDAEDEGPDNAAGGERPLHGRNPVTRHGPALAHGLSGEIGYILTRKPRATVKSLAITLALGLLYLGWIRFADWDRDAKWLPYLGLWVIGVVMGGGVCINALSFDAMRVRAALDSGARLWQLLVIKNLALLCIVAPIGFLLSALLAWRAGDLYAFFKACALMVCMILLWLGVGNVLSIVLPSRDEPLRQRKQSGSLKQFLIAFVVSYLIGYTVNAMLLWRVFAAQDLTQRLGNAFLPAVIVVASSIVMWILLTITAVALAQQPRIRRTMQKEITDYRANAEMQALQAEEAQQPVVTPPQTVSVEGTSR